MECDTQRGRDRKKLDSLRVKILGFGKFEVGEMRDVYVPYSFMTYGFLIDRKTMFNRNGHLNRSGELHFVFDYNEVHPFQYYTEENGELDLIKVNEAKSDRLILPKCSLKCASHIFPCPRNSRDEATI